MTAMPTTLLALAQRAVRTGQLPTPEELETLLDVAGPATRGATPGAPQLPGIRKKFAAECAKLVRGGPEALTEARDLAVEYARYSSSPGVKATNADGDPSPAATRNDPTTLAAGVDRSGRTPNGNAIVAKVNGEKPDTRQGAALTVVAPLREVLEAAQTDGPPTTRQLEELHVRVTGSALATWRAKVTAACKHIAETYTAGRHGEARALVTDYLQKLGAVMVAAPDPDEPDQMDPRALADAVSRGPSKVARSAAG